MAELFNQYSGHFSELVHTLEQRFRRSYRASDAEAVEGYRDIKEAEKQVKIILLCKTVAKILKFKKIKSMEIAALDVQGETKKLLT